MLMGVKFSFLESFWKIDPIYITTPFSMNQVWCIFWLINVLMQMTKNRKWICCKLNTKLYVVFSNRITCHQVHQRIYWKIFPEKKIDIEDDRKIVRKRCAEPERGRGLGRVKKMQQKKYSKTCWYWMQRA